METINKIIKYISFFILFTVLTKTYVFWASLSHTSVAMITSVVFFMTMLMIGLQLKDLKLKVSKKWLKPLIYFVVLGPILSSLFTGHVEITILLLQFFYVAIFVLAYLFYRKYGNELMFLLFLYSLLFTIVSGFFSIFNPFYFKQFAEIVNSLTFYGGRAFGFYMQPNSLAFAINIMYIGLIALGSKEKYVIYLYPLIFIILLTTGSRSNFVGFVIISLFLFNFLMKNHKKEILKTTLMLIPILLILFTLTFEYLSKTFQNREYEGMLTRASNILALNQDSIDKDFKSGSMAERLHYQQKYETLISQAPFFGYGFGIQQDLIDSGELEGAAHNAIYEILLQGGIIYLLFFIYFMIFLIKNYFKIKRNQDNLRLLLAYKIFLFFIIYYFFFSTSLFYERLVYILIAVFAAMNINTIDNNKETT